MNHKDQKTFVRALCKSIAKDVIAKIESGKIPENWDGIELRQYVADGVAWHHGAHATTATRSW